MSTLRFKLNSFQRAANAYLLYGSEQNLSNKTESYITPRTKKESKQLLQYEIINTLN